MKALTSNIRTPNQLIGALKRCRKRSKMTQEALGESSGLTQTTISKIEIGMIDPTLSTLFKLLSALDLEIAIMKRNTSGPTGKK